jgi:YqaJ-like viral recombinase domain
MSRYEIVDVPQRSPKWYAARAGRATGSKAAAVLAKIQSGEAAARRDYRLQLAVERLTGLPQESGYINAEMQRGIDLEPAARDAYEVETGEIVRTVGFFSMTEFLAGCSPDGRIDGGLVSFKCPKSATHVDYLKRNRVPPDYVPQATHELWVADDAEHYDFVSYDDRLPGGLELFVVRAYRNEFDIATYDKEMRRFLADVDKEVEALKKLRRAA